MTDALDQFDGGQEQYADWDAFFAEQPAPERTGMPYRLLGKDRRLPARLGPTFALQAQRVQDSRDPRDVRALVAHLLGDDVLDDMLDAGMPDQQFEVVLLWARENVVRPGSMSMAEAAAEYARREAAAEGKAAPRRPAKKPKKRPSSGARS